ncbi:caspase domain-containing protein [Mycena latifolia]|nr:caspase domain-containing protein [Mycena latifolia]
MDVNHGQVCVCAPDARLPTPESPSSSTTTLTDTGRKKALLIGICGSKTATPDYPELKGSHQDVADVRDLLIECYGYKLPDITILIDDDVPGNTQPTRDNILRAIAELVKDAKPGDHFCFHYCGHSTQIKNRTNSEEDGMDECIIPSDGEDHIIVDNELNAALVAPLPHDSHLVAVLDTCHSGSLLDLRHNRCNRAFVPFLSRARRGSEEHRHKVVRRNARMFSPSRAVAVLTGRKPTQPTQDSSTRMLARRSEINMNLVCRPPAADAKPRGNGAPQRTFTYRSRTVALAPSNKENLPTVPALPGTFWLKGEGEQCDSPVTMFECTGWCRDADKAAAAGRGDADGAIRADVVSLASCGDSQLTYEDNEGKSMTASLVQILRRNPNQSLKDVLVHVSHAMHTKALLRHACARTYKAQRNEIVGRAEREIKQLRRTMSLLGADADAPTRALAAAPTFPAPQRRSFLARRVESLKQLVIELRRSAGYDMDTVESPELASARPLDMERQWRM